jgi:hypothetical protein
MTTQMNKSIYLLDRSLKVDVYFEPEDRDFKDNICISLCEDCPESEKIFVADETNIYLTNEQALQLAETLLKAVSESGSSAARKQTRH